jgi:hypothetical protein
MFFWLDLRTPLGYTGRLQKILFHKGLKLIRGYFPNLKKIFFIPLKFISSGNHASHAILVKMEDGRVLVIENNLWITYILIIPPHLFLMAMKGLPVFP